MHRERVAEQQHLDRALDYALRDDALARASRISEIDADIVRAREDVARIEGQIEVASVYLEMPRQLVKYVNAVRYLHDHGDRQGLRQVLEVFLDSVVLSIDQASDAFAKIRLRGEVTIRSVRDSNCYFTIAKVQVAAA